MTFPLNKAEKQFAQSLSQRVDSNEFSFSDSEYQLFREILSLMEEREVIMDSTSIVDGENGIKRYIVTGEVDAFVTWLLSENKKSTIPSRREWIIAIVSLVLGAVLSNISEIIGFIGGILNAD